MGKLYMQWQYDQQKAQLDHKGQICAKFHKCKYNGFRIALRKRKCDFASGKNWSMDFWGKRMKWTNDIF